MKSSRLNQTDAHSRHFKIKKAEKYHWRKFDIFCDDGALDQNKKAMSRITMSL